MRTIAILSGFFLALCACSRDPAPAPASKAEEKREPFPGAAQRFPVPPPPAQHRPFSAPACDLSAEVTKSFDALFAQGMADPRGCAYRAVQVHLADSQDGDAGVRKIHAWVYETPAGPRAIAWNGLVYPAQELGPPADLAADLRAMIAKSARPDPAQPHRRMRLVEDFESASHEFLLPGRAALLYRLGRCDQAEQAWKQWVSELSPEALPKKLKPAMTDFIWALTHRSYGAHMRGDDARAMPYLRQALAAYKNSGVSDEVIFAAVWLFTDQRRRAVQPARIPALTQGRKAFASDRAWAQALIQDLENLQLAPRDESGFMDYSSDPVVMALRDLGEAAVDPLLDAVAWDGRLTRSIIHEGPWPCSRRLIRTREVAFDILVHIFGHDDFPALLPWNSTLDRTARYQEWVAVQMARWWKRIGCLTPRQRLIRRWADGLPFSDFFMPR